MTLATHTEEFISLGNPSIANRIRELVCLRHFVKTLQQNVEGVFDSLEEMFSDEKICLFLSIGILLFYISDTERETVRLSARENHVEEWNRIKPHQKACRARD